MRTFHIAVATAAAVVLGLGAAYTARVVTEPAPVPFAEIVPGPDALPLTLTVDVPPDGGQPGFTLRAPATFETTVLGRGNDRLMGRLRGTGSASSVFVIRFPDVPADPVRALQAIKREGATVLGPIRRTTVGGSPAAVADLTIGGLRVVREYRFLRDGKIYGFGLLADVSDVVALDTGDAMVATWEWTS